LRSTGSSPSSCCALERHARGVVAAQHRLLLERALVVAADLLDLPVGVAIAPWVQQDQQLRAFDDRRAAGIPELADATDQRQSVREARRDVGIDEALEVLLGNDAAGPRETEEQLGAGEGFGACSAPACPAPP
jgi:hypothetical protein